MVYKPKKADRRRKDSSSGSESSDTNQDDSESTESSDSDSGSEDLRRPGKDAESQFIRLVAGDSTGEVFFEEEPFEVATSAIAVQRAMPGLQTEKDGDCSI